MKLINVLEYFMLTMTELYLYCFLGQTLKNQVRQQVGCPAARH